MEPDKAITCPYCGEANVEGSNICGGCLRDIRQVGNPDRADLEQTAKTPTPRPKGGFLRRLRRWWNRKARHGR